jgi:hypothetical protein
MIAPVSMLSLMPNLTSISSAGWVRPLRRRSRAVAATGVMRSKNYLALVMSWSVSVREARLMEEEGGVSLPVRKVPLRGLWVDWPWGG